MIPIRVWFNKKKAANPDQVSLYWGIITVIHMALCLSWLILALSELKDSEKACWEPFTFQYLNYYIIMILVLGPALTLGLGIVLLICCLPCVIGQLIEICRD
jgi:hypothetical protein